MAGVIHMDIIKKLPLFSELPAKEIDLLLRNGTFRTFRPKDHIFRQGDNVTHFYAICRGTVQLFRVTPDGHEITSDVLITGDTLCDMEVFAPSPTHTVNACAVEELLLLQFPSDWIRNYSKTSEKFMLRLLSSMAQRLQSAQIEAEHQATMTAAEQVACLLQHICIVYGLDPAGFKLPYSKALIASRLGIEQETLSRTLSTMKSKGITVTGNHVSIRPEFEDFACASCSVAEDCQVRKKLQLKTELSVQVA